MIKCVFITQYDLMPMVDGILFLHCTTVTHVTYTYNFVNTWLSGVILNMYKHK